MRFLKTTENKLFTKETSRLNIDVSELAYASMESVWHYEATSPPFTRVYAVFSGHGTIHCNNHSIPMEAGNVYVLPTGTDFSYQCHSDMEKMYFHINLFGYSHYDLFQYMTDCAVLPFDVESLQQTAKWMEQGDNYAVIQIKTWLYQMVFAALKATNTNIGHIEEYSPLVKHTIHYVESHLHSALAASEIAASLQVSPAWLKTQFRKEVGLPLRQYVNDRLFYYAEQQLRLTSRTVVDISNQLGFCDAYYFSRMFSARYGVSPREYRKRLMPQE